MNAMLEHIYSRLQRFITETLTFIDEYWLKMVLALAAFLIFFTLSKLVRRYAYRIFERLFKTIAISNLLASTVQTVVILGGLFVALSILDLNSTIVSLLAGAGIFSLVLGFALKDIASNYFAGLIIAVKNPFHIGHLVRTDGYQGFVREISLATTLIETLDGQYVHVPNNRVITQSMENFTALGRRRVTIEVGVHYNSDLERVKEIILNELSSFDWILSDPTTSVVFQQFGPSSIDLLIRFWIRYPAVDFFKARSDALIAVNKAFNKNGITIPFPIRTLDFSDEHGAAKISHTS